MKYQTTVIALAVTIIACAALASLVYGCQEMNEVWLAVRTKCMEKGGVWRSPPGSYAGAEATCILPEGGAKN